MLAADLVQHKVKQNKDVHAQLRHPDMGHKAGDLSDALQTPRLASARFPLLQPPDRARALQ